MLPISAIVPTIGRRDRLVQTLRSVLAQNQLPSEIIVVDGSSVPWQADEITEYLGKSLVDHIRLVVKPAEHRGAGAQRNQAVALSSHPFLWFLDDDVDLEAGCLAALWQAMDEDAELGGCNAIITNQLYSSPGRGMRRLLSWIGCPSSGSLAGRCCGPAMNFLPAAELEDRDSAVEWLNAGCTLYRSEVIPNPPFLSYFHGYSLMEDLALSLEVGKQWRLRTLPEARIYHDSVPADYKSRVVSRQAMELANRWFISRHILMRSPVSLAFQLLLLQIIGLVAMFRTPKRWSIIPGWVIGNLVGLWRVVRHGSGWCGYSTIRPSITGKVG